MSLGPAWRRISDYFSSPDPRTGFCDTVALIVVGNQPFYPFYVWYAAGTLTGPAFLTWLSAPFFALAPWVARRNPLGGRFTMLAASLGNTLLAALALGSASGVELFYVPCLVLAWAGFAPGERRRSLVTALAVTGAGLRIVRSVGRPMAALSAAQAHSLFTMHAISVACLLFVMAVMVWRMRTGPALTRSGASRRR